MTDVFSTLPLRRGHFLLESGYHADTWLDLDALFVDGTALEPLIAALADRLRPFEPAAVCGPLVGGAFLAQEVARQLSTRFLYTVASTPQTSAGLFAADYALPPALRGYARDARVAVVDDVISAGSSVRATIIALRREGAHVVAAGALLAFGNTGADYLESGGIPLAVLDRQPFSHWLPSSCPLCASGPPLEDPRDGT